ncbi:uncharacterized protein LOC116263877 isoform X2 [Nymphaea colorata]|uniref:uncharacterized protein LOC116263877 isoform X2 n=1 Tax=Nymphaea colorata TaxID=210225 RepID=UPI00129D6146|nr:uncharacterized protein LOC116263877 isoform X2 [Nymphaea colorata]
MAALASVIGVVHPSMVSSSATRRKMIVGSLRGVLTNHPTRPLSKLSPEESRGEGGNWYAPRLDHEHSHIDDNHELEDQLDAFFKEVKTQFELGNEDVAVMLLEANHERVKEDLDSGVRGIEQAAILDVIALAYMGIGHFSTSMHVLEQLHEMVDSLEIEKQPLDSILIHMGGMYAKMGMPEMALPLYQRALKIEECLFGKQSLFLVSPLLGIARAFASSGRAKEGIKTFHEVIHLYERSKGGDDEDLVFPLSSLGNLLVSEGKIEEAENCFSRIISIYRKLYGENDGRTGMALCSLAHAMCGKGDVKEAIRLYKKGLRIIKETEFLSVDDSVLEQMMIDLAELLHVAGSEQEGRAILEECLLATEKIKGHGHPNSVMHLLNLAASYSRSKNFVEAERLLRSSIRILVDAVGVAHPSVAVPMLDLSVALYHLHKNEEAETVALQALSIREEAYGRQSLLVGEVLDCLASIWSRLGKDDEVGSTLWRVLDIQEKEFGTESEEVMNTLKKLVFYLGKVGKKDERLPLQQRLMKLRRKYKDLIIPT